MYYHYDGMSSVSELTDRHGDIIERYRYDAFGGLMTGITAPYNTNHYTGHQYDQDTGLIDMQARTYDAKIGRFLQEDTYQGTLDTPLSQNRYAYVMNDPVNYWDPTGNVPEEVKAQENFTEYVEVGTYEEQWRYEFQNHFTVDETSGNYQEHVGEKDIKLTWDVMTTVGWHYIASHEANLLEDGTLKLVDRRTEDHYWYEVTKESYEKITTAEDLMEQNYEALIRHGEVPEGSKQVFSGSMSFHNPMEKVKQVYHNGKMVVRDIVNSFTGNHVVNSNDSLSSAELKKIKAYAMENQVAGLEQDENRAYYAKDPLTFEDKRKVLGGYRNTPTPAAFGYGFSATADFLSEDIQTIVDTEASSGDKFVAGVFLFTKPGRIAADAVQTVGKGIKNGIESLNKSRKSQKDVDAEQIKDKGTPKLTKPAAGDNIGKGFTGGISKTIVNTTINKRQVRVDMEYPTGGSTGKCSYPIKRYRWKAKDISKQPK
ncbi:RHS repeat-associated protein [Aquisalibacillus elongatus]|uniref:RHS repeat-associated protein n=2 Tax=Aquisalibacillus elongatus TaxID=485577 RepID=A0A3N5B9K0_9BACI|nr:RHS repeat-associated protein [Aquisalibacillus elongatus]